VCQRFRFFSHLAEALGVLAVSSRNLHRRRGLRRRFFISPENFCTARATKYKCGTVGLVLPLAELRQLMKLAAQQTADHR
jgi:hypothetical protein